VKGSREERKAVGNLFEEHLCDFFEFIHGMLFHKRLVVR
jgi:hypothetical protein